MDLKRDASDKHIGIKLQKLRTIKVAFDTNYCESKSTISYHCIVIIGLI